MSAGSVRVCWAVPVMFLVSIWRTCTTRCDGMRSDDNFNCRERLRMPARLITSRKLVRFQPLLPVWAVALVITRFHLDRSMVKKLILNQSVVPPFA